MSNLEIITCGVPQGSVCGPLLYLLYINDITKSLKNCKVSLYADDTVLYYSSHNLNQAITIVQEDLVKLSQWCNKNRLTINCKKTKYCVYGMRSVVKKKQNNRYDTIPEQYCTGKSLFI